MIQIIAVGKKHEKWVEAGILRYQERLRKPFEISWQLLPHSQFEGDRARLEESERIISRLDPRHFVILLDERGKNLSSPELANIISQQITEAKNIVIIIGGAYGVDQTIHSRANLVWSLSRLVFPHQLVRLIAAEQIYRVQEITRGGGYHHN